MIQIEKIFNYNIMKNKKNNSKKSSKNSMYIITILFLCVLIFRETRIKKNKGNNHYQKKLGPSKLEIQGNIIWSYLHNISVRYIPNEKNKIPSAKNKLIFSLLGFNKLTLLIIFIFP